MDVCSSYKYGSDIGLEGLSYRSKIISISIRISLLSSRQKVKHYDFWNRHIILSLKFIGSFEAVAFSFTNLFFPPSRFRSLSSGHSLCCLPHFAPTASRKTSSEKNYLCFERNAKHQGWIEDYAHKFHQEADGSKLFKRWLAQLSENPVDWVCGRSLFAKQANFFSAVFSKQFFHQKKIL